MSDVRTVAGIENAIAALRYAYKEAETDVARHRIANALKALGARP